MGNLKDPTQGLQNLGSETKPLPINGGQSVRLAAETMHGKSTVQTPLAI